MRCAYLHYHERRRFSQMTVKITDTTIKIKVKKHPNESKYPGRACRDMMFALLDFVAKLTPEQKSAFEDETLEMDPAETLAAIQTVLPKDQIGLTVQYENGWIPTVMTVESIDLENKLISGTDVYAKEETVVSFAEASVSKAMGYFEILYRDDKPFGQPDEKELKVRIHYEAKENEEEAPAPEETDAASSPPSKPSGENLEPTDIL